MGEYLKKQYEKREMAKTLAVAHKIFDDDFKKLSDKLEDIKLSHKRQEKLLKQCVSIFKIFQKSQNCLDVADLIYRIEQELNYPMYRVYERRKKCG